MHVRVDKTDSIGVQHEGAHRLARLGCGGPFFRIALAAVVLDGAKPIVEQGILGERQHGDGRRGGDDLFDQDGPSAQAIGESSEGSCLTTAPGSTPENHETSASSSCQSGKA